MLLEPCSFPAVTSRTKQSQSLLPEDYFLIALELCGGATSYIDVEDVFIKMHEIAPARFCWRTRPELPEYKKCAKALQDLESSKRYSPDAVRTMKPSDRKKRADHRRVSPIGQQWLHDNRNRINEALSEGGATASTATGVGRVLRPLTDSDQFRQFRSGGMPKIDRFVAADLLLCDASSDASTWRSRLEAARARAIAANRQDVVEFVDFIEQSVVQADASERGQ